MSRVLSEVRSRFLAEAQIKLVEISAAAPEELARVDGSHRDNPLFVYAHRVSGVAQTLGFDGLGARARHLEDQLECFFIASKPNGFPNLELDDFLEELAYAISSN